MAKAAGTVAESEYLSKADLRTLIRILDVMLED